MSSTPHSARALSSCHQDGVLLSGTVMSSEETTTSSFINSTQPNSTQCQDAPSRSNVNGQADFCCVSSTASRINPWIACSMMPTNTASSPTMTSSTVMSA